MRHFLLGVHKTQVGVPEAILTCVIWKTQTLLAGFQPVFFGKVGDFPSG